MDIKLYTDGACEGNPGKGGWACILSTHLPNGNLYEKAHYGGYRLTTNNRMELAAVIYGLSFINGGGYNIEVVSDSAYVCNAFNKGWIYNWKKNNWKKSDGLKNADMWQTLWNLVSMQANVKFTWVKGHASNSYNNKCDELAVKARMDINNLEIDVGYEQTLK